MADGQKAIDISQHEVPYSFAQVNDIYDTTVPDTATSASAMCFHDAAADVERQTVSHLSGRQLLGLPVPTCAVFGKQTTS